MYLRNIPLFTRLLICLECFILPIFKFFCSSLGHHWLSMQKVYWVFFQTFWGLSLSPINPTSNCSSNYSNLCGTVGKVLKNDFKKSRRHIQDFYFYAFLREGINFCPCWRQIWVEMSKYLIFMLLLGTFDHFC